MAYRHQVIAQNPGYVTLYDGLDAADAMAAWSKVMTERSYEYVTIESLQVGRSD